MKTSILNPFVTGGYISPEYFCDRQKETDHLIRAVSSKRNVTLISLRRMGKTGLLKHVKHHLNHISKSPMVVYADLLPTMNGKDMLNALVSALLREKQHDKNIIQQLLSLLGTIRPKVSLDQLTGQPSLELGVETPADIRYGFEHLLHFMSDLKSACIFMIDEFQQINSYPEKNIEQILRSIIQTFPSIPFIFSGSSKHMLEPMFNAAGRPFYQSSEIMYLEKIPVDDYKEFISRKFHQGDKMISEEVISEILQWTKIHTFYTQHVCNVLFEQQEKTITKKIARKFFGQILESYDPLFASYRKLIPSHQFRLLQAIAVEDGIDKPTSGWFINQHLLNSASSVKTSLMALQDKEMIVFTEGRWQVYDVFFSRWLEYHYS